MDYKLKAGGYIGNESLRLTAEWNQMFSDHTPAEALMGLRIAKGNIIIQPGVGIGINNQPATPKLRGLLSISFQEPKKKKDFPEIEEKLEEPEEPTEVIPEPKDSNNNYQSEEPVLSPEESLGEDAGYIGSDKSPEKPSESDSKIIIPKNEQSYDNPKKKDNKDLSNAGIKAKESNNYGSNTSANPNAETNGENNMAQPNNVETKTVELQPSSPVTPESLGQLAAADTADPTLTLLLALLAVLGGGAAWKFYTQYSEQKHDQKMKEMEINAKAQGMAGAQPPPCQAANAKLEAELKHLKGKLADVDKKLSFSADFDCDLLERKVKKLERRILDIEDGEDS